jgi:peptide-methionine (S)-S-oxide reductase
MNYEKIVLILFFIMFLGLSFIYYMDNKKEKIENKNLAEAAFAMGCFWGAEDTFRKVKGVEFTEVGYMGGKPEKPSYEQVCGGDTGHAETVHIRFDPTVISYRDLLDVFWNNHIPTTPNRQGPDIGSQYRSVIFYYNDEQKRLAEESKKELEESGKFQDPIVTEIIEAPTFYRAEEYHQQYLEKGNR